MAGNSDLGNVFLVSEAEARLVQGQNLGKRSTADRDYVHARKRYKKGKF